MESGAPLNAFAVMLNWLTSSAASPTSLLSREQDGRQSVCPRISLVHSEEAAAPAVSTQVSIAPLH